MVYQINLSAISQNLLWSLPGDPKPGIFLDKLIPLFIYMCANISTSDLYNEVCDEYTAFKVHN